MTMANCLACVLADFLLSVISRKGKRFYFRADSCTAVTALNLLYTCGGANTFREQTEGVHVTTFPKHDSSKLRKVSVLANQIQTYKMLAFQNKWDVGICSVTCYTIWPIDMFPLNCWRHMDTLQLTVPLLGLYYWFCAVTNSAMWAS